LRERIRDYLIKNIIFPLPESIVKRQSDLILQDIEVSLINQGKSDEEISKTLKDASSIAMGEAERRLRISLILEKIADKERIFVTEDMVNQRIASLAQLYGTTQEMMKQHLENQGLLRPLRRSMRNEMVYDFLLKNAVVEEID
jgi:trigger factor